MGTSTSPDRPRRATWLLECEVEDELLVYNPWSERVVALNASARAIWALCDGRQSAADLAATIGQRLGVPAEALRADVCRAVAQLREAGLLEPSPA